MVLFVSIDLHPNSKGWRNYGTLGLSVGHRMCVYILLVVLCVCWIACCRDVLLFVVCRQPPNVVAR
jgi:hypothetical protein